MKPIVSIIVPVYNGEKTIIKCLDSILAQTLKEIEIIVINDNSSDSTLQILKSYKKEIVLINNDKNVGPAESRNKGLAKAKGKYIGFVDSDDYIDRDMYKTMVDNMNDDTDLVCCSRYNVIKGELKPIINNSKTTNPKEFSKTSNYNVDKLFKKSIINRYRIRQPEQYKYAEDFAFNIKYKYYAKKMVILENPFYYYVYDSEGSITNNYNQNILSIVDVLRDTMDFFKSEGVFDQYYEELLNVSKGYYFRRIREFKNFKNLDLKIKYIRKFFEYFKEYFPTYRKSLKEFNGIKYRLHYQYALLMVIYVAIKQLGR